MSKTLDENWEFLGRQHEHFMNDPGYRAWIEESIKQSPILKEQVEKWEGIRQQDQDGPSL